MTKKIINIIGSGLIGLTTLFSYTGEIKSAVVEYPGDFQGAVNNRNYFLTRISESSSKKVTGLTITVLPSEKTNGYREGYFDVGNDGTLDHYDHITSKSIQGKTIRFDYIKRGG
ncbi:MAG: hypothetical protein AABX16_04930 [Nanoarchaeota archaeon]